MSKRDIAMWFDEKMPADLPDTVIDSLVGAFWTAETARVGLTDEIHTVTAGGNGILRLDYLNRRMWYCTGRTYAKYRASMRYELDDRERAKLRPWERAAYDATQASIEQRRDTAREKAEALLATLVDPQTFTTYKDTGQLIVPSKLHRTFYAFRSDVRAGNISIIDVDPQPLREGEQVLLEARATICTAPVETYPSADILVSQLLHLRADEEHFLQMANLHTGEWSEQELEVRDRRPFLVAPRYDKIMGGYVNVPITLPTGDQPAATIDYDRRKVVTSTEDRELQDEIRLDQIDLWARAIPDHLVPQYRQRLLDKTRSLRASEKTLKALAEVQVDEEMASKWPEPKSIEELPEDELRFIMAKQWLTRAVAHWLDVLGMNEDVDDGGLEGEPVTARDVDGWVLSRVTPPADEDPADFDLVDET